MYREVKLLGACYKMHYRKEQAAALVGKTSTGYRVRWMDGDGEDRPSKIRFVNFSLLLATRLPASILVNYSRWKKSQLYSDR